MLKYRKSENRCILGKINPKNVAASNGSFFKVFKKEVSPETNHIPIEKDKIEQIYKKLT